MTTDKHTKDNPYANIVLPTDFPFTPEDGCPLCQNDDTRVALVTTTAVAHAFHASRRWVDRMVKLYVFDRVKRAGESAKIVHDSVHDAVRKGKLGFENARLHSAWD